MEEQIYSKGYNDGYMDALREIKTSTTENLNDLSENINNYKDG
jgi:hypothetical protein